MGRSRVRPLHQGAVHVHAPQLAIGLHAVDERDGVGDDDADKHHHPHQHRQTDHAIGEPQRQGCADRGQGQAEQDGEGMYERAEGEKTLH